MKHTKVELTVTEPDSCRVLSDPTNSRLFHIESLLPFGEANKLRRGNANVRPPEQKKRPFRAMLETVEQNPELFHLKNRGITYICNHAEYDERSQKLSITIPNISELKTDDDEDTVPRYGIADGGHTFEVVTQTVKDVKLYDAIPKWQMPFVRVHFIVSKDQENIESVVEALNTSLQVQQYTLDEYQNKFVSLKDALQKNGFDPDLVAFRENEDKDWHVIEVIQRMSCFLKDRWQESQPAGMYKSKGKALRLFTKADTRGEFKQLYNVARDIITLPEFIQHRFSMGDIISTKSLVKLKCVKDLRGKTYTRPGTEYPTNYKIHMAGLLPMAAGFRELLVKKGDSYKWKLPYQEVFEHCAPQLYDTLVKYSGKVALSNQLSSDLEFWAACAAIVLRARNELMEEGQPEEKVIVRKKRAVIEEEEDDGKTSRSKKDEEEAQGNA